MKLCFVLFFFLTFSNFCESKDGIWGMTKNYNFGVSENPVGVIDKSKEGHVIVFFRTETTPFDLHVVNFTEGLEDIFWSKKLSIGPSNLDPKSACIGSDQKVVVGGFTTPGMLPFLIKFSKSGDIESKKTYKMDGSNRIESVTCIESGYIITGYNYGTGRLEVDCDVGVLLKLNLTLDLVWAKYYTLGPCSSYDTRFYYSVAIDDNVTVVAKANDIVTTSVLYTEEGSFIPYATREHDPPTGSSSFRGFVPHKSNDGGVFLFSAGTSHGLYKINKEGENGVAEYFSTFPRYTYLTSITETGNGEYLVTGYRSNTNIDLVKVSNSFGMEWNRRVDVPTFTSTMAFKSQKDGRIYWFSNEGGITTVRDFEDSDSTPLCDSNYFGDQTLSYYSPTSSLSILTRNEIDITVNVTVTEISQSETNYDFIEYDRCIICETGLFKADNDTRCIHGCNGIINTDPASCSNHGECSSENNCTCYTGYYSSNCGLHTCFGMNFNDSKVCNYQNGTCTYLDNCTCNVGYYGEQCELWDCFDIMYNDSFTCTGHGKCIFADVCICEENYFPSVEDGPCSYWECFGKPKNSSSVCHYRNGTCSTFNNCTCNSGYYGLECEIWECESILMNDTDDVCCGHGLCLFPDFCECEDGYYPTGFGSNCSQHNCYGIYYQAFDVCNYRNGTCSSPDNCSDCNEGYFGLECEFWECQSILYNDSEVCSGHGYCVSPENCVCQNNYFPFESPGKDCNLWRCFGLLRNDSLVCSGNGTCYGYDNCSSCLDERYGLECELYECDGILMNDSEVCSGRGTCYRPDTCSCDENYFPGGLLNYCHNFECFGIEWGDESVCNFGNGSCDSYNNCTCEGGYFGDQCKQYECNEIHYAMYDLVCEYGRGKCVKPEVCVCSSNYTNTYCEDWNCNGVDRNDHLRVCSGHGRCLGPDFCQCVSESYSGKDCNYWSCSNISVTNPDEICRGHGNCIDLDVCTCQVGYSGDSCGIWSCGEFFHSDKEVCHKRGKCIGTQECECRDDYSGKLCDEWYCYMNIFSAPGVCSGQGECKKPNKCKCKQGYSGKECETNMLLIVVGGPVVAFASFIVFLSVLCCLVIFCLSIYLFCITCCCLLSCSAIQIVRQSIGMRYFKKLKNFDILLKEQELEDDDTIAHMKIRRELFEVPFEEIKVDKILGEGGSNSVVYKAVWKTQVVAFKCFKTRSICASQDSFDEFEREVEILGSVSHPNIIRFFGASLKTPRVGILMEFCGNGELLEFVVGYQEKNSGSYFPISGKLRFAIEISSALDYLHTRSIIHRDLKSENVLVDENENSKLMDFGLSRVVDGMEKNKTMRIGTNIYMAPEVVTSSTYTEKCDVFSFGILLWVLFTEDNNPYGAEDVHCELKVGSDENFRPSILSVENRLREEGNFSSELFNFIANLMKMCWSHQPNDRPSCKEACDKLISFRKGSDEIKAKDTPEKDGKKGDQMEERRRKGRGNDDNVVRSLKRGEQESGDDDDDDDNDKKLLRMESKIKEFENIVKDLKEENEELKMLLGKKDEEEERIIGGSEEGETEKKKRKKRKKRRKKKE